VKFGGQLLGFRQWEFSEPALWCNGALGGNVFLAENCKRGTHFAFIEVQHTQAQRCTSR
jgi:hypothetical protein